mgnify:CR=1 FL=1
MTNRQEVAEKLRQDGERLRGSCCSGAAVFVTVKDIIGIGKVSNRKAFFDRLADLIDPTCHMRETVEDERTVYVCSNCGSWKSEDKKILSLFNYCPVCGARVVTDHDNA